MKFYEVVAKCGHVGRKNYALKSFPVKAEDGREAARKARDLPRVKHHHKDAIKEVREICEEQFYELILMNDSDPYFHCTCVQDQRSYIDNDIYPEERYLQANADQICENNYKTLYIGKSIIRKPKKYIRCYSLDEGWAY